MLGGLALALVVTGGDMSITTAGIAFASAVSSTLYLLASDRVGKATESLVNATWVSGGAGVSIVARGWSERVICPMVP